MLAARNITKHFPGVTALLDVSFDLRAGEIHALCGENGAGKSTLIKLLSGLHPYGSYEGELVLEGRPTRFRSIADSERAGISVIHQELALVEEMSVAENIFLGHEPRRLGLINWPRLFQQAHELLEKFGLTLDPAARCGSLGIGQKQLVEIVKALARQSRILILDEPTAALAAHETETLLGILRQLRLRGLACIYISHRLEEVFALADRITVLRDGSTVFTAPLSQTSRTEVIRHMVGREVKDLFPRRAEASQDPGYNPVLRVERLSVADPHTGRTVLREISFSVASGEVLGLGGLMGAGRTELLMHIFGVWGRRLGGRVQLGQRALPPGRPRRALRGGLALVSEDRRRFGLILHESIGFNLSLSSLREFTRGGLVQHSREHQAHAVMGQNLRLKAPGLSSAVGKLSGGNQQKVVLGRALLAHPRVIFLDEPTRGIDVGAKLEIYELINQLTAAGHAVVLVSSELPELMGMSDRILILRLGELAGEFSHGEATAEALLASAMGEPIPAPKAA